jgi:hypothetical protein
MNLLLVLLLMFLTHLFFGIDNRNSQDSAFILERFISLSGIILLTPLFYPEQDKNIAELADSKYTSPIAVYFTRFILAAVSLCVLIAGFGGVMIFMSSEFDVMKYIIGTFSTAFFLGAAGFLTTAVSDNIVFGYLPPLVYYVYNWFVPNAEKTLQNMYLFTLTSDSLTEKYWLLTVGAVFIAAGVLFRYIIRKVR